MIKVNSVNFIKAVRALPRVVREAGAKVCADGGGAFISEFRRRPNKQIRPLTGAMTRSMTPLVIPVKDGNRLSVAFSGIEYARIHEEGGTILPRKGQYLTIPLDAAKTKGENNRDRAPAFKGAYFIRSKRGSLLLVRKRGKGIRTSPDLANAFDAARAKRGASPRASFSTPTFSDRTFVRSASVTASATKKKSDIELLFVLVKQVRMPARLGFGAAWRAFWRTGGNGIKILDKARKQVVARFNGRGI